MGMKRTATAALLLSLGALMGCTGADSRAAPRRPVGTVVVRWHGQAISPPFTADHRAIVVERGAGPAGMTAADARSIAHALLDDTASGRRDVPGCDGCVTPTARNRTAVSGRVTLAASVRGGEGRGLRDRPAWVVEYQPPQAMGCPFQPAGRPEPPATASGLDAVIVTGSRSDDVFAYHGAGTGSCAPRVQPDISASVGPGIDPGDAAR
jgi:hypothetical protein